MQTDPFDDAIRRKLEGINPPFQDKNWTQFQRFMGMQHYPPSFWQTPTRWLQPALTTAAVAGMLLTTIWQYRTNQLLTTHVQTLTQTVKRMERAQLRLQQSVAMMANAPAHVDTVFLTRPNTVESMPGAVPTWPPATAFSATDVPTASRPAPPNTPGAVAAGLRNRYSPESQPQDRLPQARNEPDRLAQAAENRQSREASGLDQAATRSAAPRSAATPSVAPTRSGSSPATPTATPPNERAASSLATNVPASSSRTRIPTSNEETLYNPSITNQPPTGSTPAANGSITPAPPVRGATEQPAPVTVNPLATLPLVTATDAFDASWQRHLRRVRYRSPSPPSTAGSLATSAAAPTQRTDPTSVRFRGGIGGEAGTAQLGLGLFAEAVIGRHWIIGTGLAAVSWASDEYTNEQQFTAKTKRDFRYVFPGSGPPMPIGPAMPRQLIDISRSAHSLVIPVQLGYRLGVGSFTLTPAVGLNIALYARETATYGIDRQPGFDDVRQSISVARPQDWYTNWTVGIGAERRWGPFAGQISPVVYLPFEANSASLNTVSTGLRARLYYQF